MGKKSVKKAANTKAQKLAVGTLAPPAGWNELFCRESDVPSLNAAIVLLKATYPQQPTASAGRYDNLNLKKLMRMMVPRPNGDGDYCAGARVLLRSDQNAAVFFFLRLLAPSEAYCMTVCSRSAVQSTFYLDIKAIVGYARQATHITAIEIINKNPLPGDLGDCQDSAISGMFTTALHDGSISGPDQISPKSPPWPAGPLYRWIVA